MSNIEPTPFGDKYVLVEHIATGGMAEIYRAHYKGIEGFAKELVIKVLREEFAAREDVVEMFLNEARVAATLTHNNVVHTYDLGELEGEYYIAMELLRGEELVDVLRRAHQVGEGLPLDVASAMVMQGLEGLHYCHSQTDAEGNPLGLVHRDINPTNLHVGYDGVCKVLDFGIAATRASALAKQGVAGKLAYMAPEQAQGQPIDARADIFAMGVMLWEMTLGKRLFRGPRDEVLRRIIEGDIPAPTFVDPQFSPALEAVIMRALEVDPADRYQNADHMFRELESVARESGWNTSARHVSAFMSELFGEGKPAVMDYDDEFDDLVDEALDFDSFEAAPEGDSAPSWARELEAGAKGEGAARKRMTLGNLAAFVNDEEEAASAATASGSGPTASASGAGASRSNAGASGSHARASGSHARASGRRKAMPKAAQTTKQRRRRTGATGSVRRSPTTSRRTVPTGATGAVSAVTSGASFGAGVVTEQQSKGGSAIGWLVGLLAVGGLLYFAYTVFTSK